MGSATTVRALRGTKCKLSKSSERSQESSTAIDELEAELELEKRVMKWLLESSPPIDSRPSPASCYTRKTQDTLFNPNNQQMVYTPCDPNLDHHDVGVLYRPDFADWASIHTSQGDEAMEASSPSETGSKSLLQILNVTTASQSQLLVAPFG